MSYLPDFAAIAFAIFLIWLGERVFHQYLVDIIKRALREHEQEKVVTHSQGETVLTDS